jgi:two-component system nitrogen regulation sensor histidine kinase NtrY
MEWSRGFLANKLTYWLGNLEGFVRQSTIFSWLEIGCVTLLSLAGAASWYGYGSSPTASELLPSAEVSILLVATLIPAIGLIVLFGRRLALKRAPASTARLHVRLVFFFSMLAAVPTILVAGFAAFLFQSGVDYWFSEEPQSLMESANDLAQGYYDQNQRQVAAETVTMAGDIRFYLQQGRVTDDQFDDFYALQMTGRELTESAIYQMFDDNSLRTAAMSNLSESNDTADFLRVALPEIDQGELVWVGGNPERIEAVAPVDREAGIYLYNARSAEAAPFEYWENAQNVANSFSVLKNEARTLQIRFNLALFVASLALVGLAVWFALKFADRQVEPLTELVAAARKVGSGNFSLRVSGRTGGDEIGMLNRAFNRMTQQLEKQTSALVDANEQLDERRAFMEAVLDSVTAGVISLNSAREVLLINGSGQDLLFSNGLERDVQGRNISDVWPQVNVMMESGLNSGTISHTRESDLLTFAVTIAPEKEGFVITFEDITRQILDQRQAAWSDVARRIAHEIKNPLTPIQLATERLKRRYRRQILKDGDLFDELTSTIVKQVGALRTMVDEFSSFARLPKPTFRNEDGLDLLRQSLFLQEIANPDIDFSLRVGDIGSPILNCDRHQFGQAMTNVIKNAVEAVLTKAGNSEPDYRGCVTVEVSGTDTEFTVAIEDNGIGLPSEHDNIIEPYITTREKGTGLGLAIVKKIIDEHSGEIIFSTTISEGTRVSMMFARDPREDLLKRDLVETRTERDRSDGA